MIDSNGNPITWQFVLVVTGLLATAVGGALWIGELSNQIAVNTLTIARLETFADSVRDHDANTSARLTPIEKRLDQLENWQGQFKSRQ